MRGHNRYSLPVSAGVDPKGWEMGLRRYVDPRYRVQAHDTFAKALKLAAARMRRTNLPVAVAVSRGNHGWVLHGFTATADPAKTSTFTVTSVRVSGPLWGLQNRTFGYDMRPNTKLSVTQFKRFFTKWWYSPKRMIWDNKFVSIQPLTTSTSTRRRRSRRARPRPQPGAACQSGALVRADTGRCVGRAGSRRRRRAGRAKRCSLRAGYLLGDLGRKVQAPDTAPRLPVADLLAVVVAGLGVVLVVLLSRMGKRARGHPRVGDPRAGWSS